MHATQIYAMQNAENTLKLQPGSSNKPYTQLTNANPRPKDTKRNNRDSMGNCLDTRENTFERQFNPEDSYDYKQVRYRLEHFTRSALERVDT